MKTLFTTFCSILSLLFLSGSTPNRSQYYYSNYENVLGTSFELKVSASSEQVAEIAEQTALNEIDRLNKILSSYDPTSEFSQWQKTVNVEVPVSKELFEVLSLFDEWTATTDGALNASAAVASAIWKKASAEQRLPVQNELTAAVAQMNKKHWSLNAERQTAIHLTNNPLVFNSFVKGYIINKTSQRVMSIDGISYSVINIGGDIKVAGVEQEQIGVANPKAFAENDKPIGHLALENKAIATSGNYKRGFKIGNEWYSHILDVRTAIPAKEIISATVVANNAVDAGALATAFNILTPNESKTLAKLIPGVEYLIITKSGNQIASDGWNELVLKNEDNIDFKPSTKAEADFEVVIDLELAAFEGRSHRPFVAVWIEDEKKESIRNLAVWYNKPRWLHDLRRWSNKHESSVMNMDQLESITGATRLAGKYSIKWNGSNDSGETVPAGKYTIYIEAAREHGTYQLIKQEIDWNNKATHVDLPSGIEIIAASLDYHKTPKN